VSPTSRCICATSTRRWGPATTSTSVLLDSTVPASELREMVEHSYDRVVSGLPKAVRERLRLQRG
jgi:hypothetical protein